MFRASLLLLAYNQSEVVREAALSCLSQDCEPIEIIFSDDCSSDETYATLCEIASQYVGPHTVVVRRNDYNLGIAGHYNALVKLANGSLLVTAAGDDVSEVCRVRDLLAAWAKDTSIDLIASQVVRVDSHGSLLDQVVTVDDLSKWCSPQQWCKKRPHVIGATHAFTKRLWDRFGDIAANVPYEDQVMAFRATCLGGGLTVNKPLVKYREGGLSSKQKATNRQERHAAIRSRYGKQLATYAQIRRDMLTVGLNLLWRGKTARYLHRAAAALAIVGAYEQSRSTWQTLATHGRRCGFFWTARQIWYTWRT